MLRNKTFAPEFCSLISNWFDMREQAPGANLLHESVSGASSLVCTGLKRFTSFVLYYRRRVSNKWLSAKADFVLDSIVPPFHHHLRNAGIGMIGRLGMNCQFWRDVKTLMSNNFIAHADVLEAIFN